ncbi:MAG TPA: hypothetical protein VMC43_00425 [Candidatus Paceibacterota bacterium]|nr:hypothetical protein [Candidatus Paceibacterota bacterium]
MRLVPFRFAFSALLLCTGLVAGFFFWYADRTYTELDMIGKPSVFDVSGRRIGGCPASTTFAKDPVSAVCTSFETPCDVPPGWQIGACSSLEEASGSASSTIVSSTATSSTGSKDRSSSKKKLRGPDPNIKPIQ